MVFRLEVFFHCLSFRLWLRQVDSNPVVLVGISWFIQLKEPTNFALCIRALLVGSKLTLSCAAAKPSSAFFGVTFHALLPLSNVTATQLRYFLDSQGQICASRRPLLGGGRGFYKTTI